MALRFAVMFRAAMRCGAMAITTRTSIIAVCLSVVLGVTGCATFRPKPLEQIPFLERAQARERDGLRVTVSVPTREEARQTFGVDLEKGQIHPVWVQMENDTDAPFWFMLHGLDPNYYSAREAAHIPDRQFAGFSVHCIVAGHLDPHCGSCRGELGSRYRDAHVRLARERYRLSEFRPPTKPGGRVRSSWLSS